MAYPADLNDKIVVFINRAQTKLGVLSEDIANKVSRNARLEAYRDLSQLGFELDCFIRSLDNNFNNWTSKEVETYIELWNSKANLTHLPYFTHEAYNLNVVYRDESEAGASVWGDIEGTLSNQTDLQAALNAKLAAANNLSDVASPATARTNLGGTTVGQAIFMLTNPGAVTWPRLNADNTVTALSAADTRTALGVQPLDANLTSWASVTRASGFDTWAATPSWTNFNSLITGTAPYWSLASGGTLTAQNDFAMGGFNATFLNGNTLWGPTGATITANTRKDIRGIGTTTANILRLANSANTARYTLNDQGDATLTGKMNIVGTALSGSSATDNWLNVTGTMPTTMSVAVYANLISVTGAGSSSQNSQAFRIIYNAGYIGSSSTNGLVTANLSAGTNTTELTMGQPSGNSNFLVSSGTTVGHNYGMIGQASNGNRNIGLVGQAQTLKNAATNIGTAGFALNTGTTPIQIGVLGWLGASGSFPATLTSAAALFDNGSTTDNILTLRDNGTNVITVADGGLQTNTAGLNLSGASSPLQVGGSAGTSGQVLTSAGTGATPTWYAGLTLGANTLTITDAYNFVFNGTTGTKLGTATSQKLSLWNATPIVQPTTAITSATHSSIGGIGLGLNDTFDGYAIGQVVKALRNIGALA